MRGTTTSYHHADGLGSILALSNASGTLAESTPYDVFGQPTAPSTLGNPFLFTGREYDPETGLYYYRARYYDPQTGRFLSRDPLGYLPDENLYRYVENDPVNWIDSFGLDKDSSDGQGPKNEPPDPPEPPFPPPMPVPVPFPVPLPTPGGPMPFPLPIPMPSGPGMNQAETNRGKQKSPKPPVPAKQKKRDGKWGWWDNKGRRWSWDPRKLEWDVEPNTDDKNPRYVDPAGQTHKPKNGPLEHQYAGLYHSLTLEH